MYDVFAIAMYFIGLLGYAKMKKKKGLTQKDFVIGGRSLNKWTTALAAHASDMSNWLFMAYPGMVFIKGGSHLWAAIGLVGIMWLNWLFVAPKIRIATEISKSVTLCGFFESRFNSNWPSGRLLTSLALFIFYTVYVAGILSGVGLLLKTLFPISYSLGVVIGVLLVLPFVLMGGYATLAQVDLFQGIFLLGVILFVPLYIIFHTGGFGNFIDAVHVNGKSFSLLGSEGLGSIGTHLLLLLGWGLGYFGQPHILTKFMGIKDPKDLAFSKNIGMTWQILSLAAATLVGFVGIATFTALIEPEKVFIELLRRYFPPLLSGLFLSAIIAAIINAMSSMLLVLSTTVAEDLYKRFSSKNLSEKSQLFATRAACILSALAALCLALPHFASIDQLVLYAWSGLGATFGPLLIATLFFAKLTKSGAWLGMFTGGLVVCLWPLVPGNIPALSIAFPLSLAAIYALSQKTQIKLNQSY